MNQKRCTPTRKYDVCFPKDLDCPAICIERIKNPMTPAEHGKCHPKCEYHQKLETYQKGPSAMPPPDGWVVPEPTGPCEQLPEDKCGFTPPPKPPNSTLCTEPYVPDPLPEPKPEETQPPCPKLDHCYKEEDEN